MNPDSLFMINILYIFSLLLIIGGIGYTYGFQLVFWIILLLMYLTISTTFIFVVNNEHDISDYCNDEYTKIVDEEMREMKMRQTIRPFEMNPILKKRDDFINAVNLNESVLHDIDE